MPVVWIIRGGSGGGGGSGRRRATARTTHVLEKMVVEKQLVAVWETQALQREGFFILVFRSLSDEDGIATSDTFDPTVKNIFRC